MHGYAVVLDTCVLFPMYLRDTLLRLAEAGTYRPRWSEHILNELGGALEEYANVDSALRIRALMTEHFPDSTVTGYEPLIPAMTNHEKDRHVLAAAVRSDAAAIVTANTSDFPPDSTGPYDIELLTPDQFLVNQWDLDPEIVEAAIRRQIAGYQYPPRTMKDFAERMIASGCTEFATLLPV